MVRHENNLYNSISFIIFVFNAKGVVNGDNFRFKKNIPFYGIDAG